VITIENSAELAARYRLGTAEGLIVTSVLPTSPAVEAGITAGDVILAIDGTDIASSDQLEATIEAVESGRTLTFTIQRGRSTGELEVVVAER
jgi:serine protease Do